MTNDDTIVISRDALSALMINNDTYTPRTIVLQRGKKGFGFVLRGSRSKFIFFKKLNKKFFVNSCRKIISTNSFFSSFTIS
jgi:hypothetical protein